MTTEIWKEFNKQLQGFINSKINNKESAQDILQDVFIRIHQKTDTIEDQSKISSWVYQITRNAIIDFYRKNNPEIKQNKILDIIPEKIEVIENNFSKCLIPFIAQLPQKDQEVLNKVSFGNISQKEYAIENNISYSATKSRVQRARHKLKDAFIACCNIEADIYGNIISYKEKNCHC